MKFLTKQQLFDNAWNGVIAQGCQSTTMYGGCKYASGKNQKYKCGIGHSIKPEVYTQKIENNTIYEFENNLVFADLAWQSGINIGDEDMLQFARELQTAHDDCYPRSGPEFVKLFKYNMQVLALWNKLKVPIAA